MYVLYHLLTSYQFFECVVYHLLNYPEKKCLFVVPEDIKTRVPQIDLFKSIGLITDYLFTDPLYGFTDSIKESEQNIIKYYDDKLSQYNEDIAHTFVAAAYRNFGFYCARKKIEFNIFEDAPGTLSGENQMVFDRQSLPNVYKAINEEHLYDGSAKFVKTIICSVAAQKKIPSCVLDKMNDFNLVTSFKALQIDMQEQIVKIYNAVLPISGKEFSIILTQWFIYNNTISHDPSIALHYQYLCDFFLKDKTLIIKPHPNDPIDYSLYFNGIYIVKDKYPSELLLCENYTIDTVISINSTANSSFKDCVKRNIRLYIDPFYPLPIYNKLLATFNLLMLFPDYNVRFYGINDYFFKECFKSYSAKESYWIMPKDISGRTILVIDNLDWGSGTSSTELVKILGQLSNESVFIFLNRNENYNFWSLNMNLLSDFFVPIKLSKTPANCKIYNDFNDETIWFFSKNKLIRNKISQWTYTEILKYVGIALNARPYSEFERTTKVNEIKLNSITKHLINK